MLVLFLSENCVMPVINLRTLEKNSYYVKMGWDSNYYFGFDGVAFNQDGLYFLETIPPKFDIYKKSSSDPSFSLVQSNYTGNVYSDKIDLCDTQYYIQNSRNPNDKTNTLIVSNSPTSLSFTLSYNLVRGGAVIYWNAISDFDFIEDLYVLNENKLSFNFSEIPYKIYRRKCGEISFNNIANIYSKNSYFQSFANERNIFEFYIEVDLCGTTYTSNTISFNSCGKLELVLNTPYMDSTGVNLIWSDVFADQYNIWRKETSESTYTIVHTTSGHSWIDTTIDRTFDYSYYIEALHDCCDDLISNIKIIRSLCKKSISDFKIESANIHGIYLRWSRPYDNCLFRIYAASDPSGPWHIVTETYDTRYVDHPSEGEHYYQVSTVGTYGGCGEIATSVLGCTTSCNYKMFIQKDTTYSNMENLRFTWGGYFDTNIKKLYDSFLVTKNNIILYNPQYNYSIQFLIYRRKQAPNWTSWELVTSTYSTVYQITTLDINALWEYEVRVDITDCGEVVLGSVLHCAGGFQGTYTPGTVLCDGSYEMGLRAVYNPTTYSNNVYLSWNQLPTGVTNRAYTIERRQKMPQGWSVWEPVYTGTDNYVLDQVQDFQTWEYRSFAIYYNIWEYKDGPVTIVTEQCPTQSTPANWCFEHSVDYNGNTVIFWESPDPKGNDYDAYWIYYDTETELQLIGYATGADRFLNIGQLDYRKVSIEAITRNMCWFNTRCYWPPPGPITPPPVEQCNHICPQTPAYWCYVIDEAMKMIIWNQPVITETVQQKNSIGECKTFVREFTYEIRHMDMPLFYILTTNVYFNYGLLNPADYGLNEIDPERFYLTAITNDGCKYNSNCKQSPDPTCNDFEGCFECDCCGYSEEIWGDKPCTLSIKYPPADVAVYYVYKDGLLVDTIYEPKYTIT